MVNIFLLAICLQSAPYGSERDLVPNQLIKDTQISTGLFYSIHVSGPDEVVGCKNMYVGGEYANALAGKSSQVTNSNLFAFHPSFVGYNVKLFHMDLRSPVVLDTVNGNLVAKKTNINYHLIRSNQASRLSRSEKTNFMKHCEDSTFKLVKTDNSYYELLSHDLLKSIGYNRADKTLRSMSSSSSSLFRLIPENYQLIPKITDFVYDDFEYSNLAKLATDVPSARIWNFTNSSHNETDTHHITIAERIENTAEWAFEQGSERSQLEELGANVEVSASFFGIGASAGVSTKSSWETRSTSLSSRKTTKIDETSFSLTTDVNVSPRHNRQYVVIWKKVDLTLHFRATVRMTALADRLNMDGSVSRMVPVGPEGVLALLQNRGYRGTVNRVGDEILNSITGQVHVKGATNGQLKTEDTPL